jgi:acetyl esterase/lipase
VRAFTAECVAMLVFRHTTRLVGHGVRRARHAVPRRAVDAPLPAVGIHTTLVLCEASGGRRRVAGVPVFEMTPHGTDPDDRRVVLEIHGGAMIAGNGAACRAYGLTAIPRNGMRTWAVDYRMPPDHPYPAGLDDCVGVYRAMLEHRRPEEIVVAGLSAGGNMGAATILRARDERLPMPAAAVLLTPELDLMESGDSFQKRTLASTWCSPAPLCRPACSTPEGMI